MTSRDWNHNEEHDRVDDFLEYQIYKDVTEKRSSEPVHSRRRGISGLGLTLSIFAALLVVGGIMKLFGIEGGGISSLVIFILTLVCMTAFIILADKLGI